MIDIDLYATGNIRVFAPQKSGIHAPVDLQLADDTEAEGVNFKEWLTQQLENE